MPMAFEKQTRGTCISTVLVENIYLVYLGQYHTIYDLVLLDYLSLWCGAFEERTCTEYRESTLILPHSQGNLI